MHDPSQVDGRKVDGYRYAQLARGWEQGILRFVDAWLAGEQGPLTSLTAIQSRQS